MSKDGYEGGDVIATSVDPVISPSRGETSIGASVAIGFGVFVVLTAAVVLVRVVGSCSRAPTSAQSVPSSSAPRFTTSPLVEAQAGQTTAMRLNDLLQESRTARNLVVNATTQVGNCQENPTQGIQEVQEAIATRHRVASALGVISFSALAEGAANSRVLARALEESVTADDDFIGWMNDIASNGCPVATASDASYQAARASSQQATADKQAFVAWWNPTATQYSLPTYSDTDL